MVSVLFSLVLACFVWFQVDPFVMVGVVSALLYLVSALFSLSFHVEPYVMDRCQCKVCW